jgi:hypothetical protein
MGQPTSPTAPCPTGSARAFPPPLDVHIGLVSSSLGTFGANGCPDPTAATACGPGKTNDDHGHLVTRSDPCGAGAPVSTYQSEGFLAWDPAQTLVPPGVPDVATLVSDTSSLVTGDGQFGCGFESQNESWYRFLVDPTPYATIALNGQTAVPSGTDTTLLQQRADFLRPDSLLTIIEVTDETDTSIQEVGIYPLFAQTEVNGMAFHLPHATTACTKPPPALGPLDPCCSSCGEATPPGCTADPACEAPNNVYTDATENISIRAFGLSGGLMSHKARYGIEFFYPPSRYVNALTSATVANAMGVQVPNPVFAGGRSPELVFYATITGVPWQLIARQDANGTPDLLGGVSALDPTKVGGFKTGAELSLTDPKGHTYWDDVVGDPEHYVLPLSPYMQESTVPRTGVDPITNQAILPVTSATNDAVNGHERTIPTPAGDIEYACIFPLPAADYIDCSMPGAECDCPEQATTNNPLCSPNPNDSGHLTLQTSAKAYPGVKNLAIAKGMGNQGVVASICAAQVTDPTSADYGYRPAVKAILDAIETTFRPLCFPKTLTPEASGQVACTILAASTQAPCACDPPGRALVPVADQCLVDEAKMNPLYPSYNWSCFCEIPQTTGSALTDCQDDVTVMSSTNGWCYVDAMTTPPLGNPALVAQCPAAEKRQLRFVNAGTPASGETIFLSCAGP